LNYKNNYNLYPTKTSDQEKSVIVKNLEKKLFGKVQSVLPITSRISVKN